MHGLTMDTDSYFPDTSSAFSRSHSSSNIPDLLSDPFKSTETTLNGEELPRSASFTYLPSLQSLSYASAKDSPSNSIDPTPSPTVEAGKESTEEKQTADDSTNGDERPKLERIGRRASMVSRPMSWIQRKKSSPERKPTPQLQDPSPLSTAVKVVSERPKRPDSFASYARKSWISSSRSPSPNRTIKQEPDDNSREKDDDSTTISSVSSSSPRKTSILSLKLEKSVSSKPQPGAKGTIRKAATLLKKPKRAESEKIDKKDLKEKNTSDSSLNRHSAENIPSSRTSTEAPPQLKPFSIEKLASLGIEAPRKKDELWSAFRALESDFQKFQAKSSALKTNVVRSGLIPFLKTYAQHPSNRNVRPEDLDRRVSVLDKWWNGLLEMLDGHSNQSVSGIDRPVLLDAIAGIMMRPEWRLPPSYFAPLKERSAATLPRSRSSTSLSSNASQFLTESVYHNVRNLFVQNLLAQMNLVVEKMSLRHAPASLVSFCGKAVAYAFFFCPGVPDMLIRIWKTPVDVIRRVADEIGLVPRSRKASTIDEVIAEFPPHLHPLGWTSAKSLTTLMRQNPNVPLGVAKVAWNGPWSPRWCGRDSDLFFVFCKYYHILAEDFLPPDAPILEKARAPGFVLVHAQILSNLDSTIHRQPSSDPSAGPNSISFDDLLSGAEASASALPLPLSGNITRLIAENRLIMLLRDFISERSSEFENARRTFAQTFSDVMRASAKRTSVFDHNACFILCDFIEEALTIYMRYHSPQVAQMEFIDWKFWFDVCRKMTQSQNSMSEIRVFSFLFSAWTLITCDDDRKEVLCLNWLLSKETFQEYFLHWCPMVRAYYMRLLCWRVCRFEGESRELDIKILGTVMERLNLVWSHYLHLKQSAEREGILSPSTAPCYPAPGRRLLIIRNDSQSASSNLFFGFDGIVSPNSATFPSTYRRQSYLTNSSSNVDPPEYSPGSGATQKKRWSLLGKMRPFNNSDVPVHGSDSARPVNKSGSQLDQVRKATASARSRPPLTQEAPEAAEPSPQQPPSFRSYSFKFSLEWNAIHQLKQPKNPYNKERKLSPPRLPAPAQIFLVEQLPEAADEVSSVPPFGKDAGKARYAGRALAEWLLLVMECNNFIERRRAEGVPSLKFMEVPTLGVDGFRKHG